MMSRTQTRCLTATFAAAAALITAGCGSSGSGGIAVDKSALGAVNEAKGDSVAVGFISDGAAAAFDTRPEYKAAQAVVKYANAHLNGLNGHPIKLTVCETKGTPAGAKDCAN